jgi:membrane protein required for colicin V production
LKNRDFVRVSVILRKNNNLQSAIVAFLDIILILFLFIGTFKGLKNGLFVEFSSFIGLLVGLWVALKFSDITRDFLGDHLGTNPKMAYFFAFVITFAAIVIGIRFMAKALTKVADFSGMGILNNIGGGLFGFARALLIMSVLLSIFEKVNFTNAFASPETLEKSVLYQPVKALAHVVYPFLSHEVQELRIDLSKQDFGKKKD